MLSIYLFGLIASVVIATIALFLCLSIITIEVCSCFIKDKKYEPTQSFLKKIWDDNFKEISWLYESVFVCRYLPALGLAAIWPITYLVLFTIGVLHLLRYLFRVKKDVDKIKESHKKESE